MNARLFEIPAELIELIDLAHEAKIRAMFERRKEVPAILAAVTPAIQAAALRDAADAFESLGEHDEPSPVAQWLRGRAGYIERGEDDPRTAKSADADAIREELL